MPKVNYSKKSVAIILMSSLEIVFNTMIYSGIFFVIENSRFDLIIPYLLLVIVGFLIFSVIGYLKEKSVNASIQENMERLKSQVLRSFLSDHASSGAKSDISDRISLLLNDFKYFEEKKLVSQYTLIGVLATGILLLVYACANNLPLTIVFILFSVIPPFATRIMKKRIQGDTDEWLETNEGYSSAIKDFVKNIAATTSFDSEGRVLSRTERYVHQLEGRNAALKNSMAFSEMLVKAITYSFIYFPIAIGIYATLKGYLTLSAFIAIQYSSSWIVNSFIKAATLVNTINSAAKVGKKIDDQIRRTEAPERSVPVAEVSTIEFRNVSFRYPNTSQATLENINLLISPLEKVLIKGDSGSGKSTLLKLFSGELVPTSGEIYLNGVLVDSSKDAKLAIATGIINQEPQLFNDSIKFNITLDYPFTEEEIDQAVEDAGLGQLVEEVGLSYDIGEEGKNLSGGQAKRLEIARALLFRKPILLADETGSSLDREVADSIIEVLLRTDRIVIDIEHNVSEKFVEDYDQVFIVKDRQISDGMEK